jgi:NADH-quinone oxidoreductase subunit J
MQIFADNWHLLLPLLLGAFAVWWMMPTNGRRPRIVAALAGLGALVVLADILTPKSFTETTAVETVTFYILSLAAIVAAALMIASRNPVYGALWFAIVTLSVCGLFVLQGAPFLAASTIVVYAGAIIVTFLFVIMLAQQSGKSSYDVSSRQPFFASVTAFVLLGVILFTLQKANKSIDASGSHIATSARHSGTASALTIPPNDNGQPTTIGTLSGLGRALFGDYLYAVEMAGTLLLVASIGAIAMAPRRAQGTL